MMKVAVSVGLLVGITVGVRAQADQKVALPSSPQPPVQVVAGMDESGRLVLRMHVTAYQPKQVTVNFQGEDRQVTTYELVPREEAFRPDPSKVRVYDALGKKVDAQELPRLLKRETLALYVYGEELDPLNLRLVKEGPLTFVYAPPKAPAPDSDATAKAPGNSPVPGLADLLKKQEYVAVPLHRMVVGYLGVHVRIGGKKLFLIVDTGAPQTTLDRYRVRHLDLEWDDYAQCDLDGIEIGEVKTGPLTVGTYDLTKIKLILRPYNDPPCDGLLGADVMRQFSAVIDHSGAVLYLRKQKPKE